MLMASLISFACCDDIEIAMPDTYINIPIVVNGTFTIRNICTGEEMNSSIKNMFDKDTLCIVFQPEEKYKDKLFTITCEDLKSIGDSLFVLKDKSLSPDSLLITATCQSDTTIRVEDKFDISVSHAYAVVPFCLEASQDLLLLSTAEVTYTDADGQEHTFDVSDDKWVRSEGTFLYEFVDDNGQKHVTFDKTEGLDKGWTLILEKQYGPDATYTFDVRYYHLGIDASVSVTYKPKENITLSADTYYLYHYLDRKKADITISNGLVNDIYAPIGRNATSDYVPQSELNDYFSKLQSTPDVFKLNITVPETSRN